MVTKPASVSPPPPVVDACEPIAFYRPQGFYNGKTYHAEESVGYLVRRIVSMMAQHVDGQLESSTLTNAQWLPLIKLYMGSATTVAELARECELDAGAMTRLLDRLEAKNLCRRVRSSEDRRVVNIELTEDGMRAAKAIPAVLCEMQNRFLAGFKREEWEMLKGFLRRIHDNGLAIQAGTESTDK
jgi:DNA-binding MarR family transcriptional regulator